MAQRNKQNKLAKERKLAAKRRHRQAALRARAAIRDIWAIPAVPTTLTTQNRCEKCTACCTVIGVEELGKPHHRPCPHITENGCAIYDHRPQSCRGFGCLWLDTPGADESLRPDNLGAVFTLRTKSLPVGFALFLEVWEVREGAMKTKRVRDFARSMEVKQEMISATYWYPANVPVPVGYAIDADRWPEDVQYGNRHGSIRLDREGGRDFVYRGDTAARPAIHLNRPHRSEEK